MKLRRRARADVRTALVATLALLTGASSLAGQAIASPPRPSRPPPRSPPCCAYVDGLVTTGYVVGAVQVAGVLAPSAPPPLREESPGSMPGGGMAWVPGYWMWSGSEFLWDAGRWMPIPVGATTWVPGQWQSRTDGYAWVAGRWK